MIGKSIYWRIYPISKKISDIADEDARPSSEA